MKTIFLLLSILSVDTTQVLHYFPNTCIERGHVKGESIVRNISLNTPGKIEDQENFSIKITYPLYIPEYKCLRCGCTIGDVRKEIRDTIWRRK